MNPNQIGKIARRPRGDAALRVETTRAPIQATGDGGVAAAPVRARPWALRYDFLTRLHPIQSAATNGRLITSSKTSDAAATLAVCCGRGRPRSRTAPVLGRRGMISYPTSAQPNTPQRTATSTRHQQQAMRPLHPYAAAAGDGRAPGPCTSRRPFPVELAPQLAFGCSTLSNRVKPRQTTLLKTRIPIRENSCRLPPIRVEFPPAPNESSPTQPNRGRSRPAPTGQLRSRLPPTNSHIRKKLCPIPASVDIMGNEMPEIDDHHLLHDLARNQSEAALQ